MKPDMKRPAESFVVEATGLRQFELSNKSGMRAVVTNFGGRLMSLWVPDRNGKMEDVVLGYDSPSDYLKPNPYFGALIGRYANRIARGQFQLEGKHYQLEVNNGLNSLHSCDGGFHNVCWN